MEDAERFWKVVSVPGSAPCGDDDGFSITTVSGRPVIAFFDADGEALARRIVREHNAFPALLAAVRGLIDLESSVDPAEWTGRTGEAFQAARAAVAEAVGEG